MPQLYMNPALFSFSLSLKPLLEHSTEVFSGFFEPCTKHVLPYVQGENKLRSELRQFPSAVRSIMRDPDEAQMKSEILGGGYKRTMKHQLLPTFQATPKNRFASSVSIEEFFGFCL